MPARQCSHPECTDPALARGLCSRHYQRWKRANPGQTRRHDTPLVRFESKIDRGDGTGCWLWTDLPNSAGYGVFQVGRKQYLAHRYAWELATGSPPLGAIDHQCHNEDPACSAWQMCAPPVRTS